MTAEWQIHRLFQICYQHVWVNFIVSLCGLSMIGLKLIDKTVAHFINWNLSLCRLNFAYFNLDEDPEASFVLFVFLQF